MMEMSVAEDFNQETLVQRELGVGRGHYHARGINKLDAVSLIRQQPNR